ncbi:MAG: hypothetical protein M3Q10_08300, partial [Chloroflexota bacterium]|nr:hypothetical protein [Chloroflexota bacterium]
PEVGGVRPLRGGELDRGQAGRAAVVLVGVEQDGPGGAGVKGVRLPARGRSNGTGATVGRAS